MADSTDRDQLSLLESSGDTGSNVFIVHDHPSDEELYEAVLDAVSNAFSVHRPKQRDPRADLPRLLAMLYEASHEHGVPLTEHDYQRAVRAYLSQYAADEIGRLFERSLGNLGAHRMSPIRHHHGGAFHARLLSGLR